VPETFEIVAFLFYDANGDGMQNADEVARIPNATVDVAGRSGRSEKGTGRVVVSGVPPGSYSLTVRSLPPFYSAGPGVTVAVPQPAGTELRLPAQLSIGSNRPNTFMAFGDSITIGLGSSDGFGYRALLETQLRDAFGAAQVLNRGDDGTFSGDGRARIGRGLRALKPAYTLTLYGVNDYNKPACRSAFPCDTVDNLREIVRTVKGARSLPVLATLTPPNPALEGAERKDWVRRMNDLIRPMAREEGALLVDLEAAFLKENDLASLFFDHVHPNDRGYALMANEFATALSQPAGSSSSSFEPAFVFFEPLLSPSVSARAARPPRREYHSRLR
jgi:lysophospholipase L1-like esterase